MQLRLDIAVRPSKEAYAYGDRSDGGTHGLRIRVVGVIDDQRARNRVKCCQPPGHGTKRRQTALNRIHWQPRRERGGSRRQRIACHVSSGYMQLDPRVAGVGP